MFESCMHPGSGLSKCPLPADFKEIVEEILQFVVTDDEPLDSAVFEAKPPGPNRARRDQSPRKGKTPAPCAGYLGRGLGLTQREVGVLLRLSERAIRNIERRALKKLLANSELRQAWQDYLSGELEEGGVVLTTEEIDALLGLVRTPEEGLVLRRVLRMLLA